MLKRKGQNIAEYSILIALVIAAAVAMQVYVKRGVQGRIADATDMKPPATDVGGGTLTFTANQYEPYYLKSNADVSSNRTLNERVGANISVNKTNIVETTTRATGSYEQTTNYDAGVR
ncbi:MAG: hypothetical protein NTW64_01950 [Candidatus Omnitrophica bacterium]|nr:hypothetical protein [Candidatus Omnitrophota bacterium]